MTRKSKRKKGIVGIEAAIVLIAFVLVASALAFVVLNMGMFTTQKSKEVIARAYEESTRALDISGNVVASVDINNRWLELVAIPIKLTSGARPIDLDKTAISITIIRPDGAAKHTDNGFVKVTGTTYTITKDFNSTAYKKLNLLEATWLYVRTDETTPDNLLEPGELVLLVLNVTDSTFQTVAYSRIIVEVKPATGSPLAVERIVPPNLDSEYVDLDVG